MTKRNKAQARIDRKEKKLVDSENKNARLKAIVKTELEARHVEKPDSIYQMLVEWTSESADVLESWTWGISRQWSEGDWNNTILPKISNFANLKWAEIDEMTSDTGHKMHHGMHTNQICDEAQLRLWDIEKYQDDIFRFRLGNMPRLWGFRQGQKFQIIWFDPTHQIYPVDHG